jgi:hypothetical protein
VRALSGTERRQEIADVGHVHEDGVLGESSFLTKVIQVAPLQIPDRRGIKPQRSMVHSTLSADVPKKAPNRGALVDDTIFGTRPRAPKECDDVRFVAPVG